MRSWVVVCALAASSAGGCAGCGGDDAPEVPPLPVVTGLEPQLVVGAPGHGTTFTVTIVDAAGDPVEPTDFWWSGVPTEDVPVSDFDGEVTAEVPAPGVRRATYTPNAMGRYNVLAYLQMCAPDADGASEPECQGISLGPVVLFVAGGDAVALEPLAPEVRLVVGERRPVHAEVRAAVPGESYLVPSRDEITLEVADATIASVDGITVTALAEGETTLALRAGEITESIPLIVTTGPSGSPLDAVLHRVGPAAAIASTDDSTDPQLALDSTGAPVALVSAAGNSISRLWVAEWTGSGFGHQPLGWHHTPHHDVLPAPQLALDERDRRYVTFVTGDVPGFWLAERAAAAGPDGWTYRQLPRRRDPQLAEPVIPDDDREHYLGPQFAVMPRTGGGLWIAYVVVDDLVELAACTRTLRLVEATDDALTTHDLEHLEYATPAGRSCQSSAVEQSLLPRDLYVLPPGAGQPLPRIAFHRDARNIEWSPAVLYEVMGDTWTAHPYLPAPGFENPANLLQPERLTFVLPVADDPVAFWYGDEPTFEYTRMYGVEGTAPAWTPWRGAFNTIAPGNYDPFAVALHGSIYMGDGFVRPLMRTTPYGGLYFDDPAPLFEPAYDAARWDAFASLIRMRGVAASRERIHWLVDFFALPQFGEGLQYLAVAPPRHARHTDDELAGWRIGDDLTTPRVVGAPTVLASGARVLVTRQRFTPLLFDRDDGGGGHNTPGVVVRSAGPGQPWVALGANELLTPYVFEVDGALVGLRDSAVQDRFDLVRSTDDGVTWDVIGGAAASGTVQRAVRVGDALFVAVWTSTSARDLQLYFLPDLGVGGTFTDLAVGSGQVPIVMVGTARPELQFGLVSSATGVTVYVGHLGSPVLRRYDTTGALLVDLQIEGDDPELIAPTAVRRPDGSIVALARRPTSQGASYDVVRSTDELATTSVISTNVAVDLTDTVQLLQRADGTLVLATGLRQRDEVAKAVYFTSTDGGATWSAPVMFRPDGGNGQSVIALAEEADGGLLAVIGENNSMRAWALADIGPFGETNEVFYPPIRDDVVVRVPPP